MGERSTSGADRAVPERGCLSATHDRIGSLHFDDFTFDGDEVTLYDDPENEAGFQGVCKVYRDEQGEYRARDLTDDEHRARNERIMGRALRDA